MFKNRTKIYLTTVILITLIGVGGFSVIKTAAAEDSLLLKGQKNILNIVGEEAKYGSISPNPQADLADKVGLVIGTMLSILGVIFLCLVVYSGYQWMTAGGEEEKINKAKTRIVQASIGLGIIVLSYAITFTVVNILNNPKIASGGQESSASTETITCKYNKNNGDYQAICTSECPPKTNPEYFMYIPEGDADCKKQAEDGLIPVSSSKCCVENMKEPF